jgi:serine/threonine-protein kinase HipA
MRTLDVFHQLDKVGTLSELHGLWTLTYEDHWVRGAVAFDLAPGLQRAVGTQSDTGKERPVQRYFANLLPEEDQRTVIAGEAKLDSGDDFGLLAHLGAETTGALTFRAALERAPLLGRLDKLPDARLNERIKNAQSGSLGCESPQKIAIAGAQRKLALVFDGSTFWEPSQAESSTHIVKCNHRGGSYPSSAFNEFLTMRLAGAMGLEVPQVQRRYLPEPLYLVQRFDRTTGRDGTTRRTHVIDACQLLGLAAPDKYTFATLETLSRCADLCKDPIDTRKKLFRWLVFNLLAGNDDNHLKNLSFHISPGGITLAPAYDLLCTAAYQTTAFADDNARWPNVPLTISLPGTETFGQVSRASILDAGAELGVPRFVCEHELEQMTDSMPAALARLIAAVEHENIGLPVEARAFLGGELRLARTIQHLIVPAMLELARC